MKRFDVVTLFPGMFDALTEHGITQRARGSTGGEQFHLHLMQVAGKVEDAGLIGYT